MPAFSYTAINEAGIKKKGILSANSEREARRLVKDLQLTPLKITESKDITKSLKVKNKDIVIMTRQLSTLLDANTPIIVYCGGGSRASLAGKTLIELGFKNVQNLEGGFRGWKEFSN